MSISWLLFAVGIVLVFIGADEVSKDGTIYGHYPFAWNKIVYGIMMMCNVPFCYGFCYIVKAACRYLELHQNDSRSNEPKRKVYSDKLTDLYR